MSREVDHRFDMVVFDIELSNRNVLSKCRTLLTDMRLLDGLESKNKKERAYWLGYKSLLSAVLGIALARARQPKQGIAQLELAIELAPAAKFTRGWSAELRKIYFQLDLATILYLLGRKRDAEKIYRGCKHPAAEFMLARMEVEKDDLVSLARGDVLLRTLRPRVMGYGHRLIRPLDEILKAIQYGDPLKPDSLLRISPGDLAWWM